MTTSVANPSDGRARDAALDLLRSVALGRVILWHAFAATWMTTIAAMPVMFFVAGSLLGAGGTGGPSRYLAFLGRRGRRLLLPFWAYGIAVAATMIYVPLHDDRWASAGGIALRALTWIVPFVDPVDSTWHGGWLSNHLWYLRAYLWIVVLAPLLVAAARRFWLSVALLGLALAQLEALGRFGVAVPGGAATRVLLGDVVTYGFFALLGVAYRRRGKAAVAVLSRWALVAIAAGAAASALAWTLRYEFPDGGINGSYPLIVATGVAWLAAIGVVEPQLRRLAERPAVARLTTAVSARAVTIYLWHPAAIVIAQAVLPDRFPARPAAVVAGTALVVGIVLVSVGWVEDLAAGRWAWHLPTFPLARLTMIVPTTAAVLALTVPVLVSPDALASGAGGRGLRPPSYREALGNTAFVKRTPPPDAPFVLRGGKLPERELQEALRRWVADNPEVRAAEVSLVVQGQQWLGASDGKRATSGRGLEEPFQTHSLTKTFTLALVLREAAGGRIALDAPLPTIRGVRRPPAALGITPRHLLSHTSGLADYTASPSYLDDRLYEPIQAVNLSLRQPLLHPAGAAVHYANSNFLYLGLLLEQVTGRPYRDLVADLAAQHGLAATTLGESRPGWVGFSSGGVISTMSDLGRWGAALFTPDAVIPAHLLAEATRLSSFNIGLGLWPLCPCWIDAAGHKRASAMGHEVGYGGLFHYPRQMTVMIGLDPPAPALTPHLEQLNEELRRVLRD